MEKQEEGKGGDVMHEVEGGGGGDTQDIDTFLNRQSVSDTVRKCSRFEANKSGSRQGYLQRSNYMGGNLLTVQSMKLMSCFLYFWPLFLAI